MVGSALALSLIGLGAVQALPARKPVEQRQVWLPGGSGTFTPGDGSLPPCLTDQPLNEQPPCLLPPIVGGLNPPKEKRQLSIGDGSSVFTPGQGSIPVCLTNVSLSEQPPCILPPITGGLTFTPGKRSFVLPPDAASNPKRVIAELELDLEKLQNKPHKSQEDLDDIEAIKAALQYLAGITNISAPPGSGSTFTPGKRGFVLPPDANTNPKKVIAELELDLERLQNKPNKSQEDLEDIEAIKVALKYLAGISNISAPPGSGSTFTPGKRAAAFNPDTVGTYAAECPNLDGAELALENLLHKANPTIGEQIIEQKLVAFLRGCGITIVKSPDGTTTILKPSDKR
ncbi:uncharacterized protein THITE_24856, partial [Thermothielavioides terrestris NRRL 8126]